MYCENCGTQWGFGDREALGRERYIQCKCGNTKLASYQEAYTTPDINHDPDLAMVRELVLKNNNGWLNGQSHKNNKTYRYWAAERNCISGEINHSQILALRCFDTIFSGKKDATVTLSDGVTIKVRRRFKNDLRCIETDNYLFVEQNPWKRGSKDALLAQQGVKIMWVIEKKTNKYVARVDEKGVSKL